MRQTQQQTHAGPQLGAVPGDNPGGDADAGRRRVIQSSTIAMLVLALITAAIAAPQPPPLYGLALVHNSPTKVGLMTIDADNGAVKVIGGAHPQLFGEGDLVVVAHGTLYFLGDTIGGAVLVALNLTTGHDICNVLVDVKEIGYVGMGQSLDYDEVKDQLVLSGIVVAGKNASHAVYRAPADGTCSPFKHAGNFGEADYVPELHSSALDAKGQRLFVTLGVGKQAGAIGAIDLTPGGKLSVIIEAPPGHSLVSMHWDPHAKRLLGLASAGPKLTLHYLDPTPPGTWLPPTDIEGVPTYWDAIGGNYATASAFDARSRAMVVYGGATNQTTGNIAYEVWAATHATATLATAARHSISRRLTHTHAFYRLLTPSQLATIDVDTPKVLSHPPLGSIGPPFWPAPGCTGDCLMALTF